MQVIFGGSKKDKITVSVREITVCWLLDAGYRVNIYRASSISNPGRFDPGLTPDSRGGIAFNGAASGIYELVETMIKSEKT